MISKKDIKPGKTIQSKESDSKYIIKTLTKIRSGKKIETIVHCEPVKKHFYFTNKNGERIKGAIPDFKSKTDYIIKGFE